MQESERLQHIRQMLEKEPEDDFLNYALALELDVLGRKEEALVQLKNLILRNSSYLGAYYKTGKLLEEMGQPGKAIEMYTQGLEIAKKQNNRKAAGELQEAIWILED